MPTFVHTSSLAKGYLSIRFFELANLIIGVYLIQNEVPNTCSGITIGENILSSSCVAEIYIKVIT